jgi:hypothetical protein
MMEVLMLNDRPLLRAALFLLVISFGPAWAADPAAATFDLFTDSEAASWNTTQPKELREFSTRDLRDDSIAPTCRSIADNDADNPRIRIVAPLLTRQLTSPIDIELQFLPTASAPIRPDTFRVCYMGLAGMDITKRITDRVTVSAKGLRLNGVRLPHGHHRLVLLIADERGRLGRQEALFDIE